jgi:hypothetical protein
MTEETQTKRATSLRRRIHSLCCFGLAAGNFVFGIAASVAPSKVAPLVLEDEATVRKMGAYDLASAIAIWGAKDRRWPLLVGLRHYVFEVIGWARSKPRVAALPFMAAVTSVVALATWERTKE